MARCDGSNENVVSRARAFALAFRPGLCDELWAEIDQILS